jgi:hypothetical protein
LKDFGDAATARDLISFLSRKVVIDALHADEASGVFQPGVALAVARKLEVPTAAVAVEDRSDWSLTMMGSAIAAIQNSSIGTIPRVTMEKARSKSLLIKATSTKTVTTRIEARLALPSELFANAAIAA